MTKSELVKAVAEKAGITQAAAAEAVNAVVNTMTETLVAGEEVALLGFGTFKVANRAERTARNPHTGETVKVAASKAVVFHASKALKEKLN